MESYNILSHTQFGFRHGKSTEDAVSLLINSVSQHLDKSFDTVSSKILLQKLQNVGIRGVALDWFSSYLSDREQVTKIGEVVSNPMEIKYGVPQGSILGPTLFLVYLNDISTALPSNVEADIICYADDTAIIFNGVSWKSALTRTSTGLSEISKWLSKNLLTRQNQISLLS